MINFNGDIVASHTQLSIFNRGFLYGDALFETVKVINGNPIFWEDHYFRLMASMRILRMEIPMNFTMEFLQDEMARLIDAEKLEGTAQRIRFTVFRDAAGLYTPSSNNIGYVITSNTLDSELYHNKEGDYEVELFKDHYVNQGMLSSLKTTNKMVNILGSIYAKENGYANCILINNEKKVVETLNGNLFLVKGNVVKTPPTPDGCLKGIIRKQLLLILEKSEEYSLEESSISPFELQKADELFVTNVIQGIQSITKYRKKTFDRKVASDLLVKLNARVRLGI
ncbi:aminotransferase class IV [Spongiivirga citrea]|uniref:branched-chain-amino-acid transaminase n=1 Tax=Spongiivirga citrea TaxID=1481457 RepID=A0A6M0CHW8_9FLAO|nr:aminotransferase class IV [Spongiivirga citrea]NER17465.1 aminotransferase class IV [Spongiivirga citrea]